VEGASLVGVQKKLAHARLPAGTYRGLSVHLGQAFLRGEEGENALLVPAEPVMVEEQLAIGEGQAVALLLTMPPADWATRGFRFAPTFVLRRPARVLPRLLGLVTTPSSNKLWVFNKKAMQVADVIATGTAPHDLVLDQSRGRAFVTLSGEDAVEVFDTNTMETIRTIRLNPGDQPREMALTTDGGTLITANYGSNTASLIDAQSLFEIGRVRVGTGPVSVVMEPRGGRAYVLNSLENTLSVIQVSKREVVATVALGEAPRRAVASRDGGRLYVVGDISPDLLAVDPVRLAVAERIYVGGRPLCLAADTRTDLLYVGTLAGDIAVVDPASRMSIDTIQAVGGVTALTIDRDENTLFAVVPERSVVEKFNLVNKRTLSTIELEGGGYDVAVVGER
jgi:YVTN family beta-propeller protein